MDDQNVNNLEGKTQKELLETVRAGPVRNVPNRFEVVLAVPPELQDEYLRWEAEFDMCDRAIRIAKALDLIVEMHLQFLEQFSRVASMRVSFLQAPTPYMVAPAYYCDRALDGLLNSIARSQININKLFDELKELKNECVQKLELAERMYREIECDSIADQSGNDALIMKFIQQRKQKAALFKELVRRISSVLAGGSGMFTATEQPWLEGHSVVSSGKDIIAGGENAGNGAQTVRAVNSDSTPDNQPPLAFPNAQPPVQAMNSNSTPDNQVPLAFPHAQPKKYDLSQSQGIPETPEMERRMAIVATQRSSPRKRKRTSSQLQAVPLEVRRIEHDQVDKVSIEADAGHQQGSIQQQGSSGDSSIQAVPLGSGQRTFAQRRGGRPSGRIHRKPFALRKIAPAPWSQQEETG